MLIYYGNVKAYVSVELFDGHLKGAVYVGNDAPSYVYSYVKGKAVHQLVFTIYTALTAVNDGRPHRVQVVSAGQRLSLAVDDNTANSVSNAGRRTRFEVADKQLLYIGGMDDERRHTAIDEFHVRDATSFKGEPVD